MTETMNETQKTKYVLRGHEAQSSNRLTAVRTKLGLPDVEDLADEITHYVAVLKGEEPSPIGSPYLELAEVATAYYVRGQEMDMRIHALERKGAVERGSQLYMFRTGELRSFIELTRRAAELGSRRLTQEQLLHDQRFES